MLKKHIKELALISVISLLFGILKAGAQEEKPVKEARTIQTASNYEAKVKSLREEFAAQRESLGLSNAAGQLSTTEIEIESDLGKPRCHNVGGGGVGGGGSGSSTSSSKTAQHAACSASSKGAPVWMVNMVNLNFYMADTPLWYSSPIGPSVEIQLSYNTNFYHVGPFGNKWLLNYGSYLYPYYGGIMIIMPDGRQDLYYGDGSGGYTHPYQVFNTLTKIAENHFELKFPDGTVYVYNIPSGTTTTSNISLLVEIRDAYGQKLSLGYDANAKLMTITDALGKLTTLSYNTEGLVTQAADPFGRSASFEYDANGNLTKITDMAGYWTSFSYSRRAVSDYYLTSLAQEAGYNWGFYFEYSEGKDNGGDPYPAPGKAMGYNSRITVTVPPVTDPSVPGGKEEYYRSASGYAWYVSPKNYIPYSDPDNNNYASNVPKTLYEYAITNGNRGETGSVVSAEGNTTNYEYNDFDSSGYNTGNITTISNEVMGDMSLTYNSMGNVTSVQGWSYPATSMTYAANGVDLTGVTNGLGTISIGYNGSHDITSSTNRMGNTKTIAYNDYGQITSGTDPLGMTTNYTYDSNHLPSQVTRSGQTLKSYTYDAIGRIRTYTDGTGMTRTYDYNNLNDITKITYPDGKDISIAYSSYHPHLITAITDRSGKTTKYTYDKSQWLTKILNPEGGTTEFDYDANGNLIQLVDPNGNATGFDYDNDNRLVKKTFADGTSVSFTYDGANRLASYTNARNGSAYYFYGQGNKLTQIMYPVDLTHYTPPVWYQYDPYYRRTGMTDAAGDHTYSYDADSLLTGITGPLKNDARTFQRDAKGRTTGYASQGGQSLSYTYDALDRLTSINNSAGTFSYSYLGASPLIQKLTRPNGSYTEYQYDNVNRLTMLSNKTSSGSIINQYSYAYNAEDLRSSETITNGTPITSFMNGSTTYSYNNVNELCAPPAPIRHLFMTPTAT